MKQTVTEGKTGILPASFHPPCPHLKIVSVPKWQTTGCRTLNPFTGPGLQMSWLANLQGICHRVGRYLCTRQGESQGDAQPAQRKLHLLCALTEESSEIKLQVIVFIFY